MTMTDAAGILGAWGTDRSTRYADDWLGQFIAACRPFLRSGMTVLDVGSGRTPRLLPPERPPGTVYLGLDISRAELERAPVGSYDGVYAVDIRTPVPELVGAVDLAISWQVLEHIDGTATAIDVVRDYLCAGGHFVALLSGRNAHFSVLNRMIPERIGTLAMHRLLGREPDSVFHAHYDHCTASGLKDVFAGWSDVRIYPRFRGVEYFAFAKPLASLYLRYEDWAIANRKDDLATHYFVVATR